MGGDLDTIGADCTCAAPARASGASQGPLWRTTGSSESTGTRCSYSGDTLEHCGRCGRQERRFGQTPLPIPSARPRSHVALSDPRTMPGLATVCAKASLTRQRGQREIRWIISHPFISIAYTPDERRTHRRSCTDSSGTPCRASTKIHTQQRREHRSSYHFVKTVKRRR